MVRRVSRIPRAVYRCGAHPRFRVGGARVHREIRHQAPHFFWRHRARGAADHQGSRTARRPGGSCHHRVHVRRPGSRERGRRARLPGTRGASDGGAGRAAAHSCLRRGPDSGNRLRPARAGSRRGDPGNSDHHRQPARDRGDGSVRAQRRRVRPVGERRYARSRSSFDSASSSIRPALRSRRR